MPQNRPDIQQLFSRFSHHEASPEEIREFFRLVAQDKSNEELIRLLESEMELSELDDTDQQRRDKVLLNIKKVIGVIEHGEPAAQPRKINLKWIALAACLLLVAAVAVFFFRSAAPVHVPASAYTNDIAPGKQGATLTLANGKKIRLTDAKNGELAKEAGVVITKAANGQLAYEIKDQHTAETGIINTLSTARGETYMVKLPDGTSIWLNAASTLKYPASFAKHKTRNVELLGEAYFEVSKDKSHPFIVESNGQQVEVLGTHFNINSYLDASSTRTTLLEGSIRINNIITLKPNEQSAFTKNGLKVSTVDVAQAVAWKNGLFQFEKADIKTVMEELARWYNVDVEYEGDLPEREFTGKIFKNIKVSQALSLLKNLDVNFKISGKKIIVTP